MVIDYMFFDAGFLQNDRQAGNPSVGRGKTAETDREDHPHLFRLCAILAAFQVVVLLIAVEGLSWRQPGVYCQPPESQKNNSGFYASAREVGHPINR